jgi:hypothetical protein
MKVLEEKLRERKEKLKVAEVKVKLQGRSARPERLMRQCAGKRKCFMVAINQCLGQERLTVTALDKLRKEQRSAIYQKGGINGDWSDEFMKYAARENGVRMERVSVPNQQRKDAIIAMVQSTEARYVLIWGAAVHRTGPMGRHAVAAYGGYVYDCDMKAVMDASMYPYIGAVNKIFKVSDANQADSRATVVTTE